MNSRLRLYFEEPITSHMLLLFSFGSIPFAAQLMYESMNPNAAGEETSWVLLMVAILVLLILNGIGLSPYLIRLFKPIYRIGNGTVGKYPSFFAKEAEWEEPLEKYRFVKWHVKKYRNNSNSMGVMSHFVYISLIHGNHHKSFDLYVRQRRAPFGQVKAYTLAKEFGLELKCNKV